jgi:hypothetical protein
MIPPIQAQLFLDSVDKTCAEFLVVHWENRVLAAERDLEMRSLAGLESCSLPLQPTLNSRLFTQAIINVFVYIRKCNPARVVLGVGFKRPPICRMDASLKLDRATVT